MERCLQTSTPNPQPRFADVGLRDHALFRTLIRTSGDGIIVMDESATVLVYNDAAARLFQHAPEAILGNPATLLIAPGHQNEFMASLASAAAADRLSPYAAQSELQGWRKDGSQFPMQLRFGTGEMDGRPVVLAVVHDLTALLRERMAHDDEKAYLALIIESARDPIVSYMPDGTVRSWNRAAEETFGYKADEIIGANARTLMPLFIPPDIIDNETAIFARALKGEVVRPHETIRVARDGTPVPVLISASPIRDGQGRIIGIARILRDLRERKAHEQERALLDLAINSSGDAFTCIGLDGTVLTWNRGAEKMLGFSAAEVVGHPASWIIDKIVPPDMVATEYANSLRAAAGVRIEPYRTIRIRKDGTAVPVVSTVKPVRSEDGKILAISRTLQDMSERLVFEQQRALLSSIVETSNDAVFSKSLDGIITSWNAAAEHMFGFPAEEIIGAPASRILPPEREAEERATLDRIITGETLRHFETQRCKKDGTLFDVSISISPLRDASGQIVGAAATVRDISERKSYETRLQAMREDMIHVGRVHEMSQVSAGIAHELNQPLAAMMNYANVARRLVSHNTADSLSKLPDIASRISDQAERAGQIIRRMRDFVEKRDPHRAIIDINAITDDAVALALIGTRHANLETHFDHDRDAPPVLADRVQIQQVLVNLLRNAVEAMAGSARRVLSLSVHTRTPSIVEVAVSDTGSGIPEDIAEKLFSPFITTKPDGMGIGLAISKSIIEAHGGTLTAEPNPGGGTVFRFTLPAAAP